MSQTPPSMPPESEQPYADTSLPAATPRLSGMAITAMVMGILAIPLGCVAVGVILGLVALILGIVSLTRINREPQRFGGKAYALIGIVTGALGMLVGPAMLVILLPTMGRARAVSTRTLCGTNLKGQGTAFALYAASYGDKFPSFKGGPNLNDLGADNVTILLTMMGSAAPASSSKMFNCPSSGSTTGPTGTTMPYAYFIDRPGIDPAVKAFLTPAAATNRPSGAKPAVALQPSYAHIKDPSRAELVTDVIISATNPPGARDFAAVAGQETNHMASSNKPAGENVLHGDSHVSWRMWTGGAETPIKQNGGYFFWVIDP
jgi:hypothetical protein